jgi:hypothetical protein
MYQNKLSAQQACASNHMVNEIESKQTKITTRAGSFEERAGLQNST